MIGAPGPNSVLYHIQWALPKNMEAFDLDHYKLIVGNLTVNIDAKENELIILLTTDKEMPNKIIANIIAIDRCGRKSDSNSMPLPILTPTDGLENNRGTSTSTTRCICTKEIVSSIIATLLVTLIAVVVSMIIIWKIHNKKMVSVQEFLI